MVKNGYLFQLSILLILTALPPYAAAQNIQELLHNGNMAVSGKDISGLPSGWEPKYSEGAETTASFKTVTVNGKKAVELIWTGGSSNFGIQPVDRIKFESGRTYEFSALGKTDGGGRLQLAVEVSGNAGDRLLVCEAGEEVSAPDWKKLSICFDVPDKTAAVKVYCLNRGQGRVWYTDVSLSPVSADRLASVFPIKFGCEPAEGNAIWNGGMAVFNTFADSPCSLTFDFWGDVKKLKNPYLVIDIPPEIELTECFYPNPSINALKVVCRQSKIERDGQQYTRCVIENAKSFASIKPVPAWLRSLTVLFRPADKSATDKLFKAFCFVRNGQEQSQEKIFYINVLPPLSRTPGPKIFQTGMAWKNYDLAVSDPELFKMIIRRFEEANITCRALTGSKLDQVCRERGWQMFFMYGNNIMLAPVVAKFGNKCLAVKYDGKVLSGRVCPGFQLSPEAVSTCRDAFIEAAAATGCRNGDTVALDYEPWNSSDWCYCGECLKRFAVFAGLKTSPQPDEIRKKMLDKWADFRVRDTCDILRAHTGIARSLGSDVKVADYDYPLQFNNLDGRFRQIPKDSRLSDEFIDYHCSSYYHTVGKDAFDLISLNAATLKKPVVFLPLLARYTDPEQREYTNLKETLSPDQFKVAMVAGAASGAKGLSIWDGLKIDGKYFAAIDHGMAEIAMLEGYFYSGRRNDKIASAIPVDGGNAKFLADNLGIRVHEYQGIVLISMFNFSASRPLAFRLNIDLPNGRYRLSDPLEKSFQTVFDPAALMNVTLLPNGSKFITLGKAD